MRKFDKVLISILMILMTWTILHVKTAKAEIQPFELQLPMTCGDTNNLIQGLRERYEEEIIFMAPSVNEIGEDLFHSLWINKDSLTWTFIVVNKQKGVTCVISSGDQFAPFQLYGPNI